MPNLFNSNPDSLILEIRETDYRGRPMTWQKERGFEQVKHGGGTIILVLEPHVNANHFLQENRQQLNAELYRVAPVPEMTDASGRPTYSIDNRYNYVAGSASLLRSNGRPFVEVRIPQASPLDAEGVYVALNNIAERDSRNGFAFSKLVVKKACELSRLFIREAINGSHDYPTQGAFINALMEAEGLTISDLAGDKPKTRAYKDTHRMLRGDYEYNITHETFESVMKPFHFDQETHSRVQLAVTLIGMRRNGVKTAGEFMESFTTETTLAEMFKAFREAYFKPDRLPEFGIAMMADKLPALLKTHPLAATLPRDKDYLSRKSLQSIEAGRVVPSDDVLEIIAETLAPNFKDEIYQAAQRDRLRKAGFSSPMSLNDYFQQEAVDTIPYSAMLKTTITALGLSDRQTETITNLPHKHVGKLKRGDDGGRARESVTRALRGYAAKLNQALPNLTEAQRSILEQAADTQYGLLSEAYAWGQSPNARHRR